MTPQEVRCLADFRAWERNRRQYVNRSPELDTSELHEHFRPYFHGPRVKVSGPDGWTRTGTVSTTSGYRPAFILMHRSSDTGSWDVLGKDDRIVAVQHRAGGPYVSVRGAVTA